MSLDQISELVLERRSGWYWIFGLFVSLSLVGLLFLAVTWLLIKGVGIWGVHIPVAWGFAIVNFVWWIGIGHAGTFISAILFVLHQSWRTSINRFAEAMTLFAVACAGLYPLLHLGRPWFFYWLLPYPDTMKLWPQWRSPLIWDVFAVFTYATVSLLFWYLGMIPDLATLRDSAKQRSVKKIFGVMSLGWRGSNKHWSRFKTAYLLLAGLATPLVISVHSVVGMDFSSAIVRGWHSTIFPPYFVAGAIFSGFAMVLTLGIPMRKFLGLQNQITETHLDNCAKLLLAMGLIVAYGYVMENFFAWYGDDRFESYIFRFRALGDYAPLYYVLWICNVLVPQFLWNPKVRKSASCLFVISILVNIGMWTERYVIVITSLARDFLPSSWRNYVPTFWDYATFAGTLGLFLLLFLLFVRTLPVVALFELKELEHKEGSHG